MENVTRLIGESPAFLDLMDQISLLAPLNKPILLVGERGTGKELAASRLHYLSPRWDKSYLQINCATLNDQLVESQLFGHEVGSFTGANKQHIGRFERANGGTLFLDEIATTSTRVQEKLLRVIEYGEFERLGGNKTISTDVRLIAATNVDLPSLADKGQFREDLLDRLAFDVITLPPLRYRKEDIPLLAEYFAINMCQELDRSFFPGFSQQATETLLNHPWQGNIRELKNVVERSTHKSREADKPISQIYLDPFESPYRLPSTVQSSAKKDMTQLASSITTKPSTISTIDSNLDFPINLKLKTLDFEKQLIDQALKVSKHNQKVAADNLQLTYHQFRAYLRKFKNTPELNN